MTGPLGRPVDCPCGSGAPYDSCCGPLHRQQRLAGTPLELMRSRYSAFVLGDVAHLFRTWHPRTRPPRLVEEGLDPTRTWTRLEVLGHGEDWVEFDAHHTGGVQHERSRFERRAGRWVYVDAIAEHRASTED